MLGILVFYFIGKYFKTLAETYKKKPWPWVILSIVVYFAGTFIGGLAVAILGNLFNYNIESIPDMAINLMALPFGLLAAWLLYYLLEKNWKRNSPANSLDTIDAEMF